MLKDLLRETQPVVYRALKNACEQDRVSNAYLFTGPEGTPKYEAAQLLAMSLLCEKGNGLACETCNTCRRVREGEHADVIVLDGSSGSVSKEQIDAVQEKFSRTAAEEGTGKAVYIIRNAENASLSAMNSMLKFLEEPGSHVTAVLTADNISRLLPTIVSRCVRLPFVPIDRDRYTERMTAKGIQADDAYLLCRTVRNEAAAEDIYASKEYERAQEMLKQLLGLSGNRKMLLTEYELDFRVQSTDRAKSKESDLRLLTLFLDLIYVYAADAVQRVQKGPQWYREAVMNCPYSAEKLARLIAIASEQKDRVNKYNDLNLVMAQTCYRLEEWTNE